ncbi:MAG: Lrp/AsnC family transcriptional regulator [Chitinivibrionales bacterium]|nr:Lrp/AsnC family transcriptional regulator [Chitinivibrionales bacterium]
MQKIDEINKKILHILQENATITNSELANQIGLAPATTLERVKKLEKHGIINKYVALINYEKIGKTIIAFVEVSLKEHASHATKQFGKDISKIPEVLECFHITGSNDFLIKIITADIKSYEDFAINKLAAIPNIGKINTIFVLSTIKSQTAVLLD